MDDDIIYIGSSPANTVDLTSSLEEVNVSHISETGSDLEISYDTSGKCLNTY